MIRKDKIGLSQGRGIRMGKCIKKVWNIITWCIVALVVILASLLVGSRLMGLHIFSVLSGSMEPTYPTGSLIFVQKVDPFTLTEGDVITFMLDEDIIATHRIVEVVPDEEDASTIRFRTKGDANDAPDGSLVHYKNVVGSPVFCIPKLGYVMNYIQHPPGTYVAFSAFAVLLLLLLLPDLIFGSKDDDKKKKTASTRAHKAVTPSPRQKPVVQTTGRHLHTDRAGTDTSQQK